MRMSGRNRRWSFVVSRSLFAARCSSFALGTLAVVGWGTPLPTRYIRIKTLGRTSCQSLEREGVRGKVLTTKELGVTFSESHPA